MSDIDNADELEALPPHLREEIDLAFDRALEPEEDARTRRRKRRRLNPPGSPAAGGFLADDPPGGFIVDDDTGGGFLPATSSSPGTSSRPSPRARHTHIPLSAIPAALKLLKLDPDDDEVLSTFNEAATGWSRGKRAGEEDEEGVSREDWQAVCAVLLAQREEEEGRPMEEDELLDEGFSESDDEGDVWNPQGADYDDEEDEVTEYEDTPTPSTRRKAKGRLSSTTFSFADLTSSQKRECRDTFELFLDPDEKVGPGFSRRIKSRDLVRVAKLLNEKLSDAQIGDMLGLFSDSSDTSLGIEEFSRIMIEAKMV